MIKKKSTRLLFKYIVGIAMIVLVTILVGGLKNSQINIVNTAMIFFFAVAGQYIMLGLGGMLGMCSITFLGLGAFMTAFLNTKQGWPIIPSMLVGTISSAVLALGLGLLLLRLQGPYFVFGTIGVVYIGTAIFQNFMAFTGGPNGTSGIAKLEVFGYSLATFKNWIPVLSVLVFLLILLMYRIKDTAFGRGLMAVRDDPTAALSLGINVYLTKVIAFMLAGLLAGFGGALYAVHNGTISASLFTFTTQTKFIIMLMLGGVMSPVGALCGTVLVNFLPEIARFAESYLNLLYGVMIIVLMIFMPMGIAGLFTSAKSKILAAFKKRRNGAEKEGNEHVVS